MRGSACGSGLDGRVRGGSDVPQAAFKVCIWRSTDTHLTSSLFEPSHDRQHNLLAPFLLTLAHATGWPHPCGT